MVLDSPRESSAASRLVVAAQLGSLLVAVATIMLFARRVERHPAKGKPWLAYPAADTLHSLGLA